MAVLAKICGINSPEAMAAAIEGGAAYVGLVFYPPSPRNISPQRAAELAAAVPSHVAKVGLFVDPDDDTLRRTLESVALDFLQLHGGESPQRVAEIGKRFGVRTLKAVRIAGAADVERASDYVDAADRLLFDLSSAIDARSVTRDALRTVADSAQLALSQETGVDLDQEAANLLRFQQAFQANGRVIQAAADVFDTILGIG